MPGKGHQVKQTGKSDGRNMQKQKNPVSQNRQEKAMDGACKNRKIQSLKTDRKKLETGRDG